MTRWTRVAAGLFLLVAAAPASSADRPQWGQAGSRNMVSEETGLPDSFDPQTGSNLLWRAPLGTDSYATPVVARGRVLIGTNNGQPRDPRHTGDRGVLLCLDEKSGALLWQLVVPKLTNSMYWDWPRTGLCSPPTVEGDRVYGVSNRGEVYCLDLLGQANGNDGPYRDEARHAAPTNAAPVEVGPTDADILWLYDLPKELHVRQHDSAHGSILLRGGLLYVNTSNGVDDTHKGIASPDAPSLVVLDKTAGRLVACDGERIGPKIFHSTWSSPSCGEARGRPLVFFGGGDGVLYAFEAVADAAAAAGGPAVLKKAWSFDCDPAAPKTDWHSYLGNRHESPSNIKGMPVFFENRVYVTAGGDLWWGKNEAWLKCVDAGGTGDVTRTAAVWSYPLAKHSLCTPAIRDGLVYATDCGGTVHCIDAATGRACWTHEVKGDIWASPLVADGKVYVGTRRGEFLVFAAGREKRLLSDIELGAAISGTPVAANGVLYVATAKTLYAAKAR